MEVFEFEKCLMTRLEESMSVLSWKEKQIPASQVRDEWSYFIELQMEPAGWEALWKIPRVICEELKLQYPTVVFGKIEQVIFKELKANFIILAVEDNEVHLPERQEVKLEDLWPTKNQENRILNIEKTADCIDSLRFFYKNIWMPWDYDNDDDLDWGEKHLESRIRFYYALQKKDIKRPIAVRIRSLLCEARYIQNRREYLELDLSDNESLEESFKKTNIPDLMHLHLRLPMIKCEIEMLENPEMRKIFEDVKYNDENSLRYSFEKDSKLDRFRIILVTQPVNIEKQLSFIEAVKQIINKDDKIQIFPCLQDALTSCNSTEKILLSSGQHNIKFLENLNDNGSIEGLNEKKSETIISSMDDESILFVFDGNFTLRNLTLKCNNIRTGIVIKSGEVRIENCNLIGDGKSSTKQGIIVSGNSKLILDSCCIENFAIGMVVNGKSNIVLKKTLISSCQNGIELSDGASIEFNESIISDSKHFAVLFETDYINYLIEEKKIILENLNDLKRYTEKVPWTGNCSFKSNTNNIVVFNRKVRSFKQILDNDISVDEDDERNVSEHQTKLNDSVESDDFSLIVVDSSEFETSMR